MIYSYDLLNKKRDLADVLSTVVAAQPRFISLFPRVADATATKHEWLEDAIAGRSITATAVSGMNVTVSGADAAKVVKGTQLVVAGDSALFEVANEVTGTTVTLKLVAANGSKKTAPANNDVLNIVSTPIIEGSTRGEETSRQSGSNYNLTQIVRKDIILTGTALATNVYGNIDNQLNRQTQFALEELSRDLNRMAIFGRRNEVSAASNGTAGGLYEFGLQAEGLSVDAGSAVLDSFIINDAAQAMLGAGGNPTTVLLSPGQARVLSAEFKDKLQVQRSDDRRGAYVATVTNAINGNGITIFADPDIPDTDAWVLDPAGFGLSNLKGRAIKDEDATPKGFDGIKRMALGELTFEFKNAKQRLCRISGLKGSVDVLRSLRTQVAE